MLTQLKLKIKNYLNKYILDNITHQQKRDESLEAWFYYWLYFQNMDYAKSYAPKNCYYEFGTGWGGTLSHFLKACNRFCSDHHFDIGQIRIVLFDSFQGLPDESAMEDYNPEWGKGKFAYSRDYITEIIRKHNFPLQNVTFVEGFYETTLTPALAEQLKKSPPSILTIDVDYYSSTRLALNFLAPLLPSGAVFYFDDLYSFFLHPDMGQPKAIREFNETGTGYLNILTYKNHAGKCYIFTRKQWEHAPGK